MENIEKKHKIHHKKLMILMSIVIICLPFIGVLAKYIYKNNYNAYFNSREFYFNSNILTVDHKKYNIDNWDGTNYSLSIDINNMLNQAAWTSYNIDYDVNVTCPDTITCNLTTPTSDILTYNESKYDQNNIQLEISPNITFQKGDEVEVTVTATSRTKYQKTLSATFILTVTTYGINYNITDSENSYFLTFNISNTTSVAKNINLSFDNSKIRIDNTNTVILKTSAQDIIKDNNDHIKGLNLKINPAEEIVIQFFKEDITKNYTYPLETNTSIITVNEI